MARHRRAEIALIEFCVLLLITPIGAQSQVGTERSGSSAFFVEGAVVGSVDGRDRDAFGEVLDVRSAGDETFVVLDRLLPGLHRFRLDGTYLPGWEAFGRGPGELLEPRAFAVVSDQIVVLDPANARHNWYRLKEDSIEFDRSVRATTSDDYSVCSLGDRLFIRGLRDDLMIHEVDETGDLLNSFGVPIRDDDGRFGSAAPGVLSQRNRGHLLCLADEDLVVVAFTYLPIVRAYSSSGTLRWETEMEGFRQLAFLPMGGRGVRFEAPEDGFHLGQGVSVWSPGSLVVQYSLPEQEAMETVEIATRSGKELDRSSEIPRVSEMSNGIGLSFRNDPFPQVRVLRRR
jgi:hypothetical protein